MVLLLLQLLSLLPDLEGMLGTLACASDWENECLLVEFCVDLCDDCDCHSGDDESGDDGADVAYLEKPWLAGKRNDSCKEFNLHLSDHWMSGWNIKRKKKNLVDPVVVKLHNSTRTTSGEPARRSTEWKKIKKWEESYEKINNKKTKQWIKHMMMYVCMKL